MQNIQFYMMSKEWGEQPNAAWPHLSKSEPMMEKKIFLLN